MPHFSIIMPAFRAQTTIATSIGSLLGQDFADWEAMVISDDGTDYAAVLASKGISDTRIRLLSTGATGTGSSNARNVGLEAATADHIAILDADDLMVPGKLTALAEALKTHTLVSSGLSVTDAAGNQLRTVGVGPDKILAPAAYKFTCFSMDSMIAYDRRLDDPRYDAGLPCLTDLDLILKLFATRTHCFHLGAAWHVYVKQTMSISNGPGTSAKIAATKLLMLDRLRDGHYPMLDDQGPAGFIAFLRLSLKAEQNFGEALAGDPALLFEDHIEPVLRASVTS